MVRGYTAAVDPGRFGWGTHAFVELSCEGRMAAAEDKSIGREQHRQAHGVLYDPGLLVIA